MADEQKTLLVEDARLLFRNFSGRVEKFNEHGYREFSMIIPPETADMLLAEGWNVRMLKSRDEEEPDLPYITVRVSYKIRPPHVTLITSGGRTILDEDSVGMLDGVDIAKADVLCNGSDWEVNGKTGVKAYLRTLFVTIEEDALQRKYAQYAD